MINKNLLLALLKLITYYAVFAYIQPTLAVQFNFTELTTDENLTFNSSNQLENATPTGLNNVTQFKVTWDNGGNSQTDTYTIGSGQGEYDFVGLDVNATDSSFVIQYVGANDDGTNNPYLLSNPNDYISAGTRGLSLSTGLNKTGTNDTETITFPVINLDDQALADDIVDLIVADIAENQSYDSWELLDSNGSTVALLEPEPYTFTSSEQPHSNRDWHRLGSQHLERVKLSNNNLDTTGSSFTNNAKSVYGLAIELSDFILTSDGVSPLDTATANTVASMRISVPKASESLSKTDYAFFGANQDAISFGTGISSAAVPFEFSPTLGIVMSLGLLGGFHYRKQIKNKLSIS